jgi:hypothetical protein
MFVILSYVYISKEMCVVHSSSRSTGCLEKERERFNESNVYIAATKDDFLHAMAK